MIVVVGAGLAGLAAALALAPSGPVTVLERRSAGAASEGAAIQLSPNAMRALAALGIADDVASVATRPDGLEIGAAGRGPVVRVPYGRAIEARYDAPYLTVARRSLHEVLAHAAADAGIAIRYRCPVRQARVDGRHVYFDDGPAIALAVAADGIGSAVRAALVGDTPRDTGWVAWRGRGAAGGRDTQLTLGAGYHLVRYPLRAAQDNCVLVMRDRGPAALRDTPIGPGLADVEEWAPWPLRTRPRHVFAYGPVAFVGDAAHAMVPFLAQGGAMGLEDAVCLGQAVACHGLDARALAAYRAHRQARVRRLAAQSERQGTLYHLARPLSLARDAVMRRVGPDGVLARVDWIYRWRPPDAA